MRSPRLITTVLPTVLSIALLTAACSGDDGATDSARTAQIPAATPTTLVGRSASVGLDPASPTDVEETPAVHVLGSVRVAPADASTWSSFLPVLDDDVETVATLGCGADEGCTPQAVASFAERPIDIMNLASAKGGNAAAVGAIATALEGQGTATLGYGEDLSSATTPIIVSQGDTNISIHAISLDPAAPQATEAAAGVAGPDALDLVRASIIESRNDGYGVVVLVDWGNTDSRAPQAAQLETIDQLVETGADAIVGHGSDFLQRFDQINQAAVVYSLGNAISDTTDPLRLDTALFRLEFGTPGRSCLLPATATLTSLTLDDPEITSC